MAKETTTIRVTKDFRKKIKDLADKQNSNIQEILNAALNSFEKQQFEQELVESFEKANKNIDNESEQKLWDNVLMDGLDDIVGKKWWERCGDN